MIDYRKISLETAAPGVLPADVTTHALRHSFASLAVPHAKLKLRW
jgi:hypothetical protein